MHQQAQPVKRDKFVASKRVELKLNAQAVDAEYELAESAQRVRSELIEKK